MKRLASGVLLSAAGGLILEACLDLSVYAYFGAAGAAALLSLAHRRFLYVAIVALTAANLQLARPSDPGLAGQECVFSGIVYGEDHHAHSTQLVLRLDRILLDDDTLAFQGLAEYSVFGQAVYLGRRLCIRGRISPPRRAFGPLHIRGKIVSAGRSDHLPGTVFHRVRAYLDRLLRDLFLESDYRIASGLTLGGSGRLDPELKEVFSRAGILHILAISGLHVGFVAGFFGLLLLIVPVDHRFKVAVVVCGLFLYAGVTGFRPSVCRAAFMASLLSAALVSQRHVDPIHIVHVTALSFLIYDPRLLFDVGAQLSFGAVYGILYLEPKLEPLFVRRVRPRLARAVLRSMAVSFSAQVFVAPLLIHYFHRLPSYAVFTNLIVVPLASIIVFLLFACFAGGWIWVDLARIIAVPVSVLIRGLVGFSGLIARLPGSTVGLSISPAILLLCYGLVWKRGRWIAVLALALAASVFSLARVADCLTVTDAAQGVLVTAPDGRTIFITARQAAAQVRFLERQGHAALDHLVAPAAFFPARHGHIEFPGKMDYVELKYGDIGIRIADELSINFRGHEHVYAWTELEERAAKGCLRRMLTNGPQTFIIEGPWYATIFDQIVIDLRVVTARLAMLLCSGPGRR